MFASIRLTVREMSPREWIGLSLTILAIGGATFAIVRDQRNRDQERATAIHERLVAAGVSALQNCKQIEVVKTTIRASVNASLKRLPKVDYYKQHPDELAQAIKNTRDESARFHPQNCYALPVVADAGLRPPKAKKK